MAFPEFPNALTGDQIARSEFPNALTGDRMAFPEPPKMLTKKEKPRRGGRPQAGVEPLHNRDAPPNRSPARGDRTAAYPSPFRYPFRGSGCGAIYHTHTPSPRGESLRQFNREGMLLPANFPARAFIYHTNLANCTVLRLADLFYEVCFALRVAKRRWLG